MLLNRSRAAEILERENLDGLIAARPVNSYYLSDYWGAFNTPVGYDGSYFAVLPYREDAPPGLVVPALEIRRLETTGGSWMPALYAYSAPDSADHGGGARARLADGTPRGADYQGWPVREGGSLQPLEQRWVDITGRLGQAMSPDARWALARAVKAAGLERGRLAVDDTRVHGWLAHCGLTRAQCLYSPEIFNEIRMVKTEAEIGLLRQAARINEAALLAAAQATREGARWLDIENVYMQALARLGGRGVYLMCGLGELPAGAIRRHEPVFFDALGQYRHYHGDFGRCVVVGEPTAEHRHRHQALCKGWEVAQEIIRPGIRYSEISRRVRDVVRAAGIPDFRDPVVHGLGLEHTDDPKPACVQPQTKPDQVLRENMVINVDMPHTEIGWGSVHMEDTVRITADGCERLGTADTSLLVVGA
ncbi:MAG: M24 family metallopeptidase [Gammaproteobacteria bacterium]|nr:M24 family metallopeptidase [Gammaproteobacteria bacterium]